MATYTGLLIFGFWQWWNPLRHFQALPVRLKTVVERNKSLKAYKWLEQWVPGACRDSACTAGSWMGGLAPLEPSAVFCLLQIPGNAQNSSLSIPLACVVGNKTFMRSLGKTLMSSQSKWGERVAADPWKFTTAYARLFSWWTKYPQSQGVTHPFVMTTGTWWEQSLMPTPIATNQPTQEGKKPLALIREMWNLQRSFTHYR